MPNTTQPAPFASIDIDTLADVQGGCGKKRCCCPAPQATAIAAPAAPAPAPLPAPAPSVSTSVQIGYA